MFSILVSLGQWVHVCLFTHLYPCLSVLIMDISYLTNRSRKSVHRQEHAPNLPVQRSGQPLNCRCPFYRVQFSQNRPNYRIRKNHTLWCGFVVDDTRLELVTSRTSSGCATSCANRPGGDKRDRTADLLNAIQAKIPYFRASARFHSS